MARRILISGASVAGTTAAWWLDAYGVKVVERAPAFRDGGQNLDVRGNARELLRRMGLEARAFERSTKELGADWASEDNRVIARFKADESDTDSGPTADLEIRRGDLARILYDATHERVPDRVGDSICDLAQDHDGVDITFHSGHCARYDAVVLAEGVGAHTRELVFPGENVPYWMDMTIAYFSIPRIPHDSDHSRQYNTVGGRGATRKPALDGKLGTPDAETNSTTLRLAGVIKG
ncbi:hypothetical protein [Xanthomonas arboricola]|uniref:hypothetical protein n=1 Tax=Xanthomonas arboricola TaxID=56448 RepID=UPI0015E2CC72|nr:hypothetical protein [Xanthomonas arboricola]